MEISEKKKMEEICERLRCIFRIIDEENKKGNGENEGNERGKRKGNESNGEDDCKR